jgi:cytochrome c-type biogenesis protein CcmH/NrfG
VKKETVILAVVIAFLVGFITGATVAILKGKKGVEGPAIVQTPLVAPQAASASPSPLEVASKIQTLKEVVNKDPENFSAWLELGNFYFDSDQPKEAIEAYSKYLAVKPNNPDVITDTGIMYRRLGEIDQALREFRKAAQSDPNHVNSRYNIGVVLLHDKQDIKGAIKAWEEYLKVDPKSERASRIRTQMDNLREMAK